MVFNILLRKGMVLMQKNLQGGMVETWHHEDEGDVLLFYSLEVL